MSLTDYRKRNLGEIRSTNGGRSLHERHGSAPVSVPLRVPPPRGAINLLSSPYHSAFQRVQPRPNKSPPSKPERLSGAMDFSQFRDSGELSDITISVEGAEFKLHKFPLYTKSDFFRALARSESEKVVLDQFPGGAETFEMVANYCYNKRLELNPDNVCKLRCAAEFLQMSSRGNLADLTDGFLLDLLTTAKLSHDTGVVVDLLLGCRDLDAIAVQAGIIGRCLSAIVDCWLMSSKWTRRLPSERLIADSTGFRSLCRLPVAWIKQLLVAAKDKNVRPGIQASIAQMYIIDKIQKKSKKEQDPEDEELEAEEKKDSDKGEKIRLPEDSLEGDSSTEKQDPDHQKQLEVGHQAANERDNDDVGGPSSDEAETGDDDTTESNDDVSDDVDIGVVMDTLLLELPDVATLAETFVPKWTAVMLGLADQLGCRCRGFLLQIGAKLLYRFTPADWAQISPDLLADVIREASRSPLHVDAADTICTVVDGYLLQLAENDQLDVKVFNQMASSVPKEQRNCHDTLFKVLEKLLKSETQQISDSDKEAMLEAVDFRRLSEAALQHAYDSKLVPDPFVTRAALALCARLRSELETARDIIRSQEEELDRFGLSGGRATTWLQDVETDFGLVTSTSREPEVSAYRHRDVGVRSKPLPDPVESFKYSPPGHDPILEKALGGRYYDDPFDVDSTYPWSKYGTRRTCYDDVDYGRSSDAPYRRSVESSPFRSTYYRSSRW